MIDAGADVNATTDKGLTVLHMAAKSSDLALMKLLIEKGAHIDTQSAIGNTAVINQSFISLSFKQSQQKTIYY